MKEELAAQCDVSSSRFMSHKTMYAFGIFMHNSKTLQTKLPHISQTPAELTSLI